MRSERLSTARCPLALVRKSSGWEEHVLTLVLTASFLFNASTCSARVGETRAQLKARFGAQTSEQISFSYSCARFTKDGIAIVCVLKKGICIYERYETEDFSNIRWRLLNTFSDNKPWNPFTTKTWMASVIREYSEYSGKEPEFLTFTSLIAFSNKNGLHIFTTEWLDIKEEDWRLLGDEKALRLKVKPKVLPEPNVVPGF